MWSDVFKLIKKLIVLVLPFFILLPVYCALFPMNYMDEEYAMYRQQREYCTKTGKYAEQENELAAANGEATDNEVIILGDSRAKAGFAPKLLSDSSYNLALGGATPIEGYYSLKSYLAHHEKPKTLILAYAPMHYMDVDTLWTRTVYFHNIDKSDFMEILETAKQYEKTEKILIENYRLEYLMYELYMPNKYGAALKNAGFVFRHKQTGQKYKDMDLSFGHTLYGIENGSSGVNGEAHEADFAHSDVIDAYLCKILDLCRQEEIKVILEQLPMNETSYGILQPSFKENFKAYMTEVATRYPECMVTIKPYCYNNELFGDADHLNEEGCKVFTAYMKEKYGL